MAGSFMRIGSFSLLSWGKGNDAYTRTPRGFRIDPRFEYNKKSEKWQVIEGHERDIFETTAPLNTVISRFADMFSGGRFVHKRMNGTADGEIIDDSEIVTLLENPNPLQSGEEWLKELVINYFVFGNNVILPRRIAGTPYLINNLPWNQIEIKTTGKRWEQSKIKGIIEEYRVKYDIGTDDIFKGDEVIHLRRSGGKSAIIGESVLNQLHMEISNTRGAMGFRNVNINEHGALGAWVNKATDSIGSRAMGTEEQLKIEKQLTKTHGIHDGQARLKLIPNHVEWESTAFPIKESMLFEEVDANKRAMIDAVGFNENMFSKPNGSKFDNLNAGIRSGYENAIFPFANNVCQKLKNGLLLPNNEWLELEYSHLPIFKENEKEKAETSKVKAEAYKSFIDAGIDPTEARMLSGIDG